MNYVLYGEEQYLLQESLRKIIASNTAQSDEMNTITYDALKNDVNALLEDAQTIPFFSEHKVILVQNANFFSTSDDTGWDMSALDTYLDHPMESTILVFVGEYEKLDARKKIVKKAQKTCKVLQFRKLDDIGKKQYVEELCGKCNIRIEPSAKQELLLRLPNDILTIRNEVGKLELYGDDITKTVVKELVTRPLEEDVFQLVNAVVDKDIQKSFHLWEDMQVLNKDVIYLIATLAAQFRFLYQVKVLMDEGKYKDEITASLNAHPYRVQLTMNSAQRLHSNDLLVILERLATLDQQIKAGLINKEIGFEMFLLSLRGE